MQTTRPTRTLIAVSGLLLLLTGCGRDIGGSTYTSGNTVGKVIYGTVISARPVTVKDNDKLENNTLGGVAGGALGGVGGSGIGKGNGQNLATVGGVIAGAVLGAAIQDQLSTSDGMEYIVQLDKAQKKSPAAAGSVSTSKYNISGRDSVADDIKDSIDVAQTESDAIAVVQRDEAPIAVGSRVVIVYSDDRPRVVPLR